MQSRYGLKLIKGESDAPHRGVLPTLVTVACVGYSIEVGNCEMRTNSTNKLPRARSVFHIRLLNCGKNERIEQNYPPSSPVFPPALPSDASNDRSMQLRRPAVPALGPFAPICAMETPDTAIPLISKSCTIEQTSGVHERRKYSILVRTGSLARWRQLTNKSASPDTTIMADYGLEWDDMFEACRSEYAVLEMPEGSCFTTHPTYLKVFIGVMCRLKPRLILALHVVSKEGTLQSGFSIRRKCFWEAQTNLHIYVPAPRSIYQCRYLHSKISPLCRHRPRTKSKELGGMQ
ncbi:hypothetical protein P171DRAFT_511405 [Karstenula rhodostoma CBS 690.94]|uniref:Uncharacterized protein n=1 Tax=Karstenula rhodostoma CBS 690.94 TaxID=1392251 RepID=A0A9P4PQT7_9PLEO|nr:hypothetical protein P171DRAFT_511405 [Karstenula rhodostoma CBS 690.94]